MTGCRKTLVQPTEHFGFGECGPDGLCPECAGKLESLLGYERCETRTPIERADAAEAKAEQYKADWYSAKSQFGQAMAKAEARVREMEAVLAKWLEWHDWPSQRGSMPLPVDETRRVLKRGKA